MDRNVGLEIKGERHVIRELQHKTRCLTLVSTGVRNKNKRIRHSL